MSIYKGKRIRINFLPTEDDYYLIYFDIYFDSSDSDRYEMVPSNKITLDYGEFKFSNFPTGVAINIIDAINNFIGGQSNNYYADYSITQEVDIYSKQPDKDIDIYPSSTFDQYITITDISKPVIPDDDNNDVIININNITVHPASFLSKQINVRYNFTLINPTYPLQITTPISKTINGVSDQWLELNRYPTPQETLTVQDISGIDTKPLPRVDIFSFENINVIETSTTATVQIFTSIIYSDNPDGVRVNLEYCLDAEDYKIWQSSNIFTDVVPDNYTVRVRDQFGRIINRNITVQSLTVPEYRLMYRVIGDKPPFNLFIFENSTQIDVVDVDFSGVLSYFIIDPNSVYCLKAIDSIGNEAEVCDIQYFF